MLDDCGNMMTTIMHVDIAEGEIHGRGSQTDGGQ